MGKPCEKRHYLNRIDAMNALECYREIGTKRDICNVYLCKKCGYYHLTSWSRRKVKAIRKYFQVKAKAYRALKSPYYEHPPSTSTAHR